MMSGSSDSSAWNMQRGSNGKVNLKELDNCIYITGECFTGHNSTGKYTKYFICDFSFLNEK